MSTYYEMKWLTTSRRWSKHPGVKVGLFEIRAAADMTLRESDARRRSDRGRLKRSATG
jgi:hypothetical protein